MRVFFFFRDDFTGIVKFQSQRVRTLFLAGECLPLDELSLLFLSSSSLHSVTLLFVKVSCEIKN